LTLKLQSRNTAAANFYLNNKKLMILVNSEEVSFNNTSKEFVK